MAGVARGRNPDYRSPTVASARAGQGRERSVQTWLSAFSTCISEREKKEGAGRSRG